MQDWFTSIHSNAVLRQIIARRSEELQGVRLTMPIKTGRCTLVNKLEELDELEARPAHAEYQLHFN